MSMKQTKVWLTLMIALSLLGLASACSKTPEGTSDNTPTATGKPYAPKGNEGSITGTIAYNGAPPAPKTLTSCINFLGKRYLVISFLRIFESVWQRDHHGRTTWWAPD